MIEEKEERRGKTNEMMGTWVLYSETRVRCHQSRMRACCAGEKVEAGGRGSSTLICRLRTREGKISGLRQHVENELSKKRSVPY